MGYLYHRVLHPSYNDALQEALLPIRVMSVKLLSTEETICTTNPQQVEVTELVGYS